MLEASDATGFYTSGPKCLCPERLGSASKIHEDTHAFWCRETYIRVRFRKRRACDDTVYIIITD